MIATNSLPERMKAVADRIGADHRGMINWYEVEYAGDAKIREPRVEVNVSRRGVQFQMSPRRLF